MALEPFRHVTGAAAPLLVCDINTDMIAPTRRRFEMKSGQKVTEREIDPSALFAPLRYDEQGEPLANFVLNRPGFLDAKILLAGANFGCGSSREQAVWLLADFGIRCVVAPSFGGIFYDSCFKNGILPVTLAEKDIAALSEEAGEGAPSNVFTIDLEKCEIRTPSDRVISFPIAAFRRKALMAGLDDISMTLQLGDVIGEFQDKDRSDRPWIYLAVKAEG